MRIRNNSYVWKEFHVELNFPLFLNPENKFANFDNGFLTIFYNKIVDWAHNKKYIVVPLDHYLVLTIKG